MNDYCLDYYPEWKNGLSDFFDKITSIFESGELLLLPEFNDSIDFSSEFSEGRGL